MEVGRKLEKNDWESRSEIRDEYEEDDQAENGNEEKDGRG